MVDQNSILKSELVVMEKDFIDFEFFSSAKAISKELFHSS